MRIVLMIVALWSVSASLPADETEPFDGWVFPGAKLKEQSLAPVSVTSADKTNVQSVSHGLGQYVTEKPFHEVVAFYVRKSGLKPPNWSILGREFPGTEVYIPAHFSRTNFYREEPSVTLLHYIRPDVASVQLLVTDHPQVGFISISITRGKNDDQTLVQLIQHSSKAIQRNVEPSAARRETDSPVVESEETRAAP